MLLILLFVPFGGASYAVVCSMWIFLSISIARLLSHAFLHHRYGIRDVAGGGRSSARETIGRVAAGVVAKKLLATYCGKSMNVI